MTLSAALFSKNILRLLNTIGGTIPFSILEWGLAVLLALILLRPRRLRNLCALILAMLLAFLLLWLPLYAEPVDIPAASDAQMHMLCANLIDDLNVSALSFDVPPDALPAKQCAFPFWMRALNLDGFYSFFTGEALIAPDLPPESAPFTAVHEVMHGRGIAHEGLCNAAAYAECRLRGGAYADSANLCALRYAMGSVKRADVEAYHLLLNRMRPETLRAYRAVGGTVSAQNDYAILAEILAAEISL